MRLAEHFIAFSQRVINSIIQEQEFLAQCVHFCQLCRQHDDPVLHLYGSPIPVVEES